jgi:hemolysin activation/secretion protein
MANLSGIRAQHRGVGQRKAMKDDVGAVPAELTADRKENTMQTNAPRPDHIDPVDEASLESSPAADPQVWTGTHPGPVDVSTLLHRTREARAVWNHALEEAAQPADGTDLGLSSRIRALKHAELDDG